MTNKNAEYFVVGRRIVFPRNLRSRKIPGFVLAVVNQSMVAAGNAREIILTAGIIHNASPIADSLITSIEDGSSHASSKKRRGNVTSTNLNSLSRFFRFRVFTLNAYS